ncbi:MAG: glycerophosphodiester phosphodiesterase, partial [Lachnospiraceae bacterium]|nr:glycerophosphodiester phosphodiesterase [Lachnospiraceae bacterium]
MLWLLLYFWCVKPNRVTKQREIKIRPFTERLIAHRGLFDRKLSIPENSMLAFERAVSYGFGIELDVRLTRDHELVVFHDATLKRMCGVNKAVSGLTYEELCRYPLDHTGQRIPRLEDVLNLVDAKVPLIIEIKAEKEGSLAAQILCNKLKDCRYRGAYCVESFYPFALQWLRIHEPDVIRGQLVTDFKADGKKRNILAAIFLNGLLLNVFSRP